MNSLATSGALPVPSWTACLPQAIRAFHFEPSLDVEHGFGQLLGELLHARALAGGQNDGFHQITDDPSVAMAAIKYSVFEMRDSKCGRRDPGRSRSLGNNELAPTRQ